MEPAEQHEQPTKCVFRVWKDSGIWPGDTPSVVALFPDEVADAQGHCTSYMHVGQHGAADYHHVIAQTRPAKPDEYAALRAELEGAPYHYNLHIVRRWVRS